MTETKHLQIAAVAHGALLTPAQKRFNTLIRQIEAARRVLADWQANIPRYLQAHAKVMAPLQASYVAAQREWAFALDGVFDQPGWPAADRAVLSELVCNAAGELLDDSDADTALRALFDKHSEVDFDTDKEQALLAMKQMTEAFTGLDLGDAADIRSGEDLFQRMQQSFAAEAENHAQAQAEHAEQAARKPHRRASAAQQRRDAEAQLATQSVREIYRKLASALHPDREPDADERAVKTALMQRANQAYAANDLLGLLELQLEIEQVDAAHLANASAERLKHYNKVLAEQLNELKQEIARTQVGFCMNAGLTTGWNLRPDRLLDLVDAEARELRSALARQQLELRMFADRAATKRWLKRQRQALREAEFDDELF